MFSVKVVKLYGEIDISNIDEINGILKSVADESPHGFIIDLSQVTYIDSSFIRSILKTCVRLSETRGILILRIINDRIRHILEVIGIDKLLNLEIYDTLEAAKTRLSEL